MAGLAEIFDGAKVIDKQGNQVDLASHCKGKRVGIYFSAHWCPPCRRFTPELVTYYKNRHQSDNIEIIFASSDRDEHSFKEYFGEMPWLSLDFNESEANEKLSTKYDVSGIPTLVIVNADTGDLITDDGRSVVDENKAF